MQRVADGTLLFAGIFAAISGMIMWLNTGLLLAVNGLSISPDNIVFVAKTVHIVAFLVFIVFGLESRLPWRRHLPAVPWYSPLDVRRR